MPELTNIISNDDKTKINKELEMLEYFLGCACTVFLLNINPCRSNLLYTHSNAPTNAFNFLALQFSISKIISIFQPIPRHLSSLNLALWP